MRHGLAIMAFILAATFVTTTLTGPRQALAITGCCKERASEQHAWQPNGQDFTHCQQLNASESPPDNIFEPVGHYWWDVAC